MQLRTDGEAARSARDRIANPFYLSLRGVQLADFFQLDAQAMPERAFRTKFVEQRFRLVERIWRHILAFEHIAEAALNLGFGKQGENLQAAGALGASASAVVISMP